jgi:predicted MFS family arabinose efflux permease
MNNSKPFNINSVWSIVAVVMMPVIGGEMFIVQPGFVQGLVEYGGFTEQQAGFLMSAEMTGFALITVVLIYLSKRINWRRFMAAAMAVAMVGNLASMMVDNVTLYAVIRFVVGLATGGIVSLGFTSIGLTAKPDRNFGFAIMASMIYGAMVMAALPWILGALGVNGLLLVFAGLAAAGLTLVFYLPESGEEHVEVEADAVDLSFSHKLIAVVAMLCYFLAQGAVWAYLFLFGTSAGLTETSVATGLTLSQFTGIAGAFAAVVVGARFTRLPPLAVGIAAAVIPLLMFLYSPITGFSYLVAVLIYNFGFNLTHPYLLATMAAFDRHGRVVIYAVSAQTLGLALGPALGAMLIDGDGYANLQWFSMGFFTLCLLLISVPALAQARMAKQVAVTKNALA